MGFMTYPVFLVTPVERGLIDCQFAALAPRA